MPSEPLAPGLLIAAPPLGDPNFERTVVLLALHGPRGSLGFVINRIADIKLGEVLGLAGYAEIATRSQTRVFSGGPVEPGSGWIVTRDPTRFDGLPGVIEINDRMRISSSRTAFDQLAKSVSAQEDPAAVEGDDEVLVVLGYSGWGPGQLEGEIAQGAWLPIRVDEEVIFDVEADKRWFSAHAILGITPLAGMGMRIVGDA